MRRARGCPARTLALALLLAAAAPALPAAAQRGGTSAAEVAERLRQLRPKPGGVLGLMGYNVTPDGSTNALQLNRATPTGSEGSPTLILGQLGFGFTVSESVPIFLEGYIGYARYDPRAVFGGESTRLLPVRWNNVTGTIGIGYDFRLTDQIYLRPILNFSLGYAASDVTLFGYWLDYRTGQDTAILTGAQATAYGIGGSLALAYYDFRPERDIDIELRYTQIELRTFGDTVPAARGSATAQTLGLWARYRWPMGVEVLGRQMRWVLDGSATSYLGDQRDALGFAWAVKFGGGIEFDTGRQEFGALGLNLQRVRLIGRYFHGDNNATGWSFGIGVTF
jgi:hypothetical protein